MTALLFALLGFICITLAVWLTIGTIAYILHRKSGGKRSWLEIINRL